MSLTERTRKRASHEEGSHIIEMAFVFIIFLIAIFAIIEGSLLFFNNNTVKRAARDGVRQAGIQGGFSYGKPKTAADSMMTILENGGIKTGEVVVTNNVEEWKGKVPRGEYRIIVPRNKTYAKGENPSKKIHNPVVKRGGLITVRVVYSYPVRVPLIAGLLGNTRTVDVTYAARAEQI